MATATAAAWYETFFTGVALDLWTRLVPPEQTAQEFSRAPYRVGDRLLVLVAEKR